MSSEVKLKDIAQALGVSVVTVSNAMSGKKGVSKAVRQQIEAKAVELGYDTSKYRKKEQLSSKIGVIVAEEYLEVGTSFYWDMYQKVAYAASQKQGLTLFEIIPKGTDGMKHMPKVLLEEIDGLIVIGMLEEEYMERIINTAEVPVVLLDFQSNGLPCDAVLSQNYLGMYRMTRYLLERGHRDIGFLGAIRANENIMDRYFGYRKAMEEQNLSICKEWVIDDRDVVTGEIRFDLPHRIPTAFVCNCDYTAGILYDKLEEKGLSVPEDLSIVGYDNYLYGHPFAREITTYAVDLEGMAEAAVRLMLKKIKNPAERNRIVFIKGNVIERNSVKNLV